MAAPSRDLGAKTELSEEEAQELEKQRLIRQAEEEAEYEDVGLVPVVYKLPVLWNRFHRFGMNPGHLVQRKWIKKGLETGFVSVPFLGAVRKAVGVHDVNLCVVSRRENADDLVKQWGALVEDLQLFDISGEVTHEDLDPIEPDWNTPLDQLPEDAEMIQRFKSKPVLDNMYKRYTRKFQDLTAYSERNRPCCPILRQVVAGLPPELLGEETRVLVRNTVREILNLLLAAQSSSDASRLRWRFACTDDEGEVPQDFAYRSFFVVAGRGMEFVPQPRVDAERLTATGALLPEQVGQMDSEEWVRSVTAIGTNITEALKRVPAGWTVFAKGNRWPEKAVEGAVIRLPPTGRRLIIEVEHLEGGAPRPEPTAGLAPPPPKKEADEEPEAEAGSSLAFLGPLAAVGAVALEVVRRSAPFQSGSKLRKELNDALRGLQRVPVRDPESLSPLQGKVNIDNFEQQDWMDFGDASDAPVVLLIGGQSYTGRAISRKLVLKGYHVVLLKPGLTPRFEKIDSQGAVLASVGAKLDVEDGRLPRMGSAEEFEDLYDVVMGIDKLVVCECDADGSPELTGQAVRAVLGLWQVYRADFAEKQRSFASKVRLFDFGRDTDYQLWQVEPEEESDVRYGQQASVWMRTTEGLTAANPKWNTALWWGKFTDEVGQSLLKSPVLKLNFRRFNGLMLYAYNAARDNSYSFFLRHSDFEETRIQYEFEFRAKASRFARIRMPFRCFKPVRCDGTELPEEEVTPLRREDVVQMGVVHRLKEQDKLSKMKGDVAGAWSFGPKWVKAMRLQPEPQVVYLGPEAQETVIEESLPGETEEEDEQDEFAFDDSLFGENLDEELAKMEEAEAAAAAELDELGSLSVFERVENDQDTLDELQELTRKPISPVEAVINSGLAYTIMKVNGLNEHPGGKYPISVIQSPPTRPPLSTGGGEAVGRISRGDAAELVVSSLMEPSCVNAELTVGEASPGKRRLLGDGREEVPADFRISSTLQENVKDYLKRLAPCS